MVYVTSNLLRFNTNSNKSQDVSREGGTPMYVIPLNLQLESQSPGHSEVMRVYRSSESV